MDLTRQILLPFGSSLASMLERLSQAVCCGALLLFLGIPFALGSWWGLILVVPLVALILWRLKQEERYLSTRLPGYRDYCAKVTNRLIPLIW
jgi:protein-S-isoprenylcysteine O-methyltransferase Ste14